jgi:hypothetical protein
MCECEQLVDAAKNFVIAGVTHILSGESIDEESKNERMKICRGCDKKNGEFCGICLCYLPVKAGWKEQDCPLGKWPKIQ